MYTAVSVYSCQCIHLSVFTAVLFRMWSEHNSPGTASRCLISRRPCEWSSCVLGSWPVVRSRPHILSECVAAYFPPPHHYRVQPTILSWIIDDVTKMLRTTLIAALFLRRIISRSFSEHCFNSEYPKEKWLALYNPYPRSGIYNLYWSPWNIFNGFCKHFIRTSTYLVLEWVTTDWHIQ